MMVDYAYLLTEKFPDRMFTMADTYESLEMLDGGPKPSQAELDAAWTELLDEREAEREAKEQARASALAKLAALGLTEEEALALVGGI